MKNFTFKKKNIIIPLLIVLSLIIWSRNIYLVFVGVTQNDEEYNGQYIQDNTALTDTLLSNQEGQEVFLYQAKYRDPFKHWLLKDKVKKQSKPSSEMPIIKIVEKPEPELPRFRFSGVLKDSSGILAIIENPEGKTYFVREMDVIEGVSILKIDSDSIYYQFEKRKFKVGLEP